METLHPGLYVQEVQGTPPMEGVSTSTGAFVGVAPKGKVGEAVFITNWAQFVREFGGFDVNSHLAYAVKGFFENGGKRCYVTRVVHYDKGTKTSAQAVLDLKDSASPANVVAIVKAKSDGLWGNKIAVEVKAGADADHFDLLVYLNDTLMEVYDELTLDTIEDSIRTSQCIELLSVAHTVPAPVAKTTLAGGKDGLEGLADTDYIGDSAVKNGLYSFDNVRINLVAVPAITSLAVLKGILTYVDGRKDCFAVLDTPKGQTPQQVKTFVKSTANLASEYAGVYYPWVEVADPIGVGKSPTKLVPPSGHMMGIYARMDTNIGCWRAPAGTDAQVLGIIKLEYNVSDAEQDLLNPECINCVRSFEGQGVVAWGARTLSKGEYKYIPVRRVAMFIEQSILANLMWTVFKPNDAPLWNASKNTVENFLTGLWAQGGLKGASPKDAFFVICDESINTPEAIDAGRMYVDLGICPLKPAEFVIFRLSLKR